MKRLLYLMLLLAACARPATAAPTFGLYSTGVNNCCVRLCCNIVCTHYRLGYNCCPYGCEAVHPTTPPCLPVCDHGNGTLAPWALCHNTVGRGYGACLCGSRWIVPSVFCGDVGARVCRCCTGEYTYSTTFTVPGGVTSAQFTVNSFADDEAWWYVNCSFEGGSTVHGECSCDWKDQTCQTFVAPVHCGVNTFTFLVPNEGGGTGLDAHVSAVGIAAGGAPEMDGTAQVVPVAALLGVLAVVADRRRQA